MIVFSGGLTPFGLLIEGAIIVRGPVAIELPNFGLRQEFVVAGPCTQSLLSAFHRQTLSSAPDAHEASK